MSPRSWKCRAGKILEQSTIPRDVGKGRVIPEEQGFPVAGAGKQRPWLLRVGDFFLPHRPSTRPRNSGEGLP